MILKKQPSQNTSYSTAIGEGLKNAVKNNNSLQNIKSSPQIMQNGIAHAFRHKLNLSVAEQL